MPRLLLVLALLIGAWLAIRWFVRTPPQDVIRTLKRLGLAALVLGIAFLAASGRLNWIAAVAAAFLPLLRRGWVLLRYLPFIGGLLSRYRSARARPQSPPGGQQSTVETRFLRMTLDHDSGDMDGEVLAGSLEGRFLSQLTLSQLLDLLDQCHAADSDSVALLEAYLDRHHDGWREQAGNRREQAPPPGGGPMSEEEARAILGVEAGATEDEIVQAHRRLMHKLHPDRGGSDYLAAKINQARDCLLGK